MEKSSRASINYLIRRNEGDPPVMNRLGATLVTDIATFLFDKNELSKFGNLRIIYNLADRATAATPNVCRKGCAWCCKIPVEIAPLEANYIAANSPYTIKRKLTKKAEPNSYCPLMDNQTAECTVYDHRPFNCRVFATYDSPDYCRDDKAHWSTGGPSNHYANKSLLALAHKMLEIDTGMRTSPVTSVIVEGRIKDVREWFS